MGRDLVAQAERGLRGAGEAGWAGTLERYFADLRAAHAWISDHDPQLSLRMVAQLHWYALWRCHSEVYRWADACMAAAAGSLTVLRRGARLCLFRAVYRGDLDAAGTAARGALAAAQGLAPVGARRPLEALAEVAIFRGELADAADLYIRAYDLSIGNGDFLDAAWDAAGAAADYAYGDRPEMRSASRTKPGPRLTEPFAVGAGLRLLDPRRDRGRRPAPARPGTTCSGRSPWPPLQAAASSAGIARVSLAALDARHGDPAIAFSYYERAIREWRQAGAWTPLWVTLRTLVELLARGGAWHDAAVLYGSRRHRPAPAHRLSEPTPTALAGRWHCCASTWPMPNSAPVSKMASGWTTTGSSSSRWKP